MVPSCACMIRTLSGGYNNHRKGSSGAERGGGLTVKIALDVPEEHSYIGMVRQIGRTLLEHHRVTAQDIDDLEIIVGELCSNVTRHARSEVGSYQVILEHHDTHVVLEVVDQGEGFDPQGLPPVGEPREDEDGGFRHGGFGLHLVRTLTDRVDIEHARPYGTTVRVEKRFTCTARAMGG